MKEEMQGTAEKVEEEEEKTWTKEKGKNRVRKRKDIRRRIKKSGENAK